MHELIAGGGQIFWNHVVEGRRLNGAVNLSGRLACDGFNRHNRLPIRHEVVNDTLGGQEGKVGFAEVFRLDGSDIIPYTHFSLALSKSRRFARWVAWNIDGTTPKRISRTGIGFVKDPRIPAEFQSGNELYSGNRLDRGHLARRADLLWAAMPEAERANEDSFFFTNITPQMDDFNQSSKDGVWGRVEDAVFADVDIDDLRVSVFGGPVFQDDDRVYRGTRLPREYWKVLAFIEQGQLKSRAFLLTQNLNQLEALELDEFRAFQVAVTEIEDRTHLRFADGLRAADTFASPEAIEDRQPLGDPSDIQW